MRTTWPEFAHSQLSDHGRTGLDIVQSNAKLLGVSMQQVRDRYEWGIVCLDIDAHFEQRFGEWKDKKTQKEASDILLRLLSRTRSKL